MKIIIFTTLILLSTSLLGLAQTSDKTEPNKFKYIGVLGVARSTFEVNTFGVNMPFPKYSSVEIRLGMGIVRPIGEFFELRSGLSLGLKLKRESYFIGQLYTQPGIPLRSLDEAASDRNHFVVDMPLLFQVNLRKSGVGFRAGFNGRFWAPNNADVDMLTNRLEIGTLAGITYRLTPRITTGVDFYLGLTDISGGTMYFNSAPPVTVNYNVRNQFGQFTLEYSF